MTRGAGCGNSARPDLWGAGEVFPLAYPMSGRSGLKDRLLPQDAGNKGIGSTWSMTDVAGRRGPSAVESMRVLG
jgi:hypothetical protein